jgi:cathepsin L
MKTAIILLAVFGCALAVSDFQWNYYKELYGKQYSNVAEEVTRRAIFAKAVKEIQEHNLLNDLGLKSFRRGINSFTDLTSDEFRQRNGLRMPAVPKVGGETFEQVSDESLPKTVDWRKKGYVTPIKDQAQCGSCWAFAAVASLEGQNFKKHNKLVSLSEQNLVDCSGPEGNFGCEGGLPDQAYQYIIDNKGIDTEKSYPYTAEDGNCAFNKKTIGATVSAFTDIATGDEKALQKAVATIGPISVGIDASQDSFQSYTSGIYDEENCSTTQLDHGVTVVGYGTDNGKDYWLVKNSWGTSWGIKGYIKMSRNANNQCGIATLASYPTAQ